jgi:hypothetical protein
LAINYSLAMMLAPQYSHFGPQTFCDHPLERPGAQPNCSTHPNHIKPCSEEPEKGAAAKNVCTPSVISTFIDRTTLNFSFFGAVDFWAQFAFLGMSSPPSFPLKDTCSHPNRCFLSGLRDLALPNTEARSVPARPGCRGRGRGGPIGKHGPTFRSHWARFDGSCQLRQPLVSISELSLTLIFPECMLTTRRWL